MIPDDLGHVKIRTAKSWQGKEPIYVFQANFSGLKLKHPGIKKFFVEIDARQGSFGVHLSSEKQQSLVPQGGMVNQIRKYCKGATIADILKDESNGNLWLVLYSQGQEYFIRLAKSRPPEMALINKESLIFMRLGMKGTFTKKVPLEDQLPGQNPNLKSIKQTIFKEFIKEAIQDDEEGEEDSEESEDLSLAKEQRVLLQKLKRKLKTYKKSFEKQKDKIPSEESIEGLATKAKLLQSFGYLVKDGDFELSLESEISGQEKDLVIELDEEKSLGANIEDYFTRSKKAKKSREMGLKIFQRNQKDIEELQNDIETLAQPIDLAEVDLMFDKYKLPRVQASNTQTKLAGTSKPFRTFKSSTGHQILVGKGPRENDELTKSARSNDYWIHTSAVAGSHVVIPTAKDIRESLPSQLLREAAILAIHYSKLRSDMAGEEQAGHKYQLKCPPMFIRHLCDLHLQNE